MSFIILLSGIVLLIVLITVIKLNPFLAFIIVSILIGLLNGMSITSVINSIQKGMGDLLGSLIIIISLGAMLGKLIADSGAAETISSSLMNAFGRRYLMWALVLTAFIIGIPLFYGVGFVLLVPLIITISTKYNLPVLYIGLPMLAALSVTHGFLPPHPSPTALVQQFNADIGLTLLYGFIIAVPAIIVAGPVFAQTLKKYNVKLPDTFTPQNKNEESYPGIFISIFTALLPVLLITISTICKLFIHEKNILTEVITALGEPVIAMIITVLFALYTLGIARGRSMKNIMASVTEATKDISMLLFIIGGAGALKQILADGGISNDIAVSLKTMQLHPLFAAWFISAIIRVCLGSATVAGLTAGSIVAPMIAITGVDANLMVLATGAGSLMFSHVNDTGFWMFKEYFNLSIKDTLKTWSVMETIVSIMGLAGVFVINYFITR